MNSFLKQFLYVPKHEKIPDKVMLGRVVLSAALVVGCLFVMSFSAYAYFSHSVNTKVAVLEAACFEGEVTIVNAGTNEETHLTTANAAWQADLTAGEYLVTVSHKGTASTGFFKIETQNSTYYTTQVFSAESGKEGSITFEIKVNADAKVVISANFGTSIYYTDYKENGTKPDAFITGEETIEL